MKETFKENRLQRERVGNMYRKINDIYKEQINIELVDPRNHLSILGYFFRQMAKRNLTLWESVHYLTVYMKNGSIFINGKYVTNTLVELEEELLHVITQHIQEGG
ncbi:hypothetical protein [Salirhabdus salicampi]|uniref:hypothetical protein n=1 Tax=Salirhabdus salicampi TaxID=476102 RepID=UPI0020C43D66|nr:hypothetical protein [Salirhabdus salicampi]MCP8615470.1 hypothetical protein [Salirhabdus salicampi]